MEEPVRVRVVFEDRHVLRKSQRSEGLKHCWILLRPELTTISDLASHLNHCFALKRSYPHGLILSMEGFVLPSFESTYIFKDKDIISVRTKAGSAKEVIEKGDDGHHIQDSGIVEKQPKLSSNNLLEIKEFQENSGGYKNKDEDDACTLHDNTITVESPLSDNKNSNRKRKRSNMLQGSRGKKPRPTSLENPDIITKNSENNNIEQNHSCSEKRVTARKSSRNKNKLSNGDGRLDTLVTSQVDNCVKNATSSVPREERNDRIEMICQRNTCEPHVNDVMRKLPSRSARRKKAKRQWLREMANSKTKETPEHIQCQVSANGGHKKSPKHQKMDSKNEMEEGIVPIVVRPGHIRFEPIDGEPSKQQSNRPVETMQWNGTTSKKKGQKWGREKTLSWRDDDDNGCNEESNEKSIAGDGNLADGHIDFEGLCPLTRLPKEGEVIVYRMVELSSSWCPELSSFRVGKVSSYDSISMKVVLDSVPEYPILHGERKDEESILQAYKEDGSLEIDFPSLVDVRLLKGNNASEEKSVHTLQNEAAPVSNWELALCNSNVKETVTSTTEKRRDDGAGWEQIGQALKEKKEELQKTQDGWSSWGTTKDTLTPPWSYRALRRSALGPTVALLRGRKGK